MSQTARVFFDAIESGQDWEQCKRWCHEDASFFCQAEMLGGVTSVEGYAAWMRGLFTPIPDRHPEIKALAADEERSSVVISAVVHGTQTGEGGPVPPTGKKVAADYVYVFNIEGGMIRHMTKIWNDGYTLKLLGWA